MHIVGMALTFELLWQAHLFLKAEYTDIKKTHTNIKVSFIHAPNQ